MQVFIDYFTFCIDKFINILNSLKIGEFSILYYILGAIIIGFIIKLVKGGSNEFDNSFNFSTGSIIETKAARYRQDNNNRKKQLLEKKAFVDGFVSREYFDKGDNKSFSRLAKKHVR